MRRSMRSALIFVGFVIFAAASIALAVFQPEGLVWQCVTYCVYALAAASFALAVRQTALFFKQGNGRKGIARLAHKNRLTTRIYDDHAFRIVVIGYCSLAINSFFALTKAAAGWYASSTWLTALAFYYLFLCLIKALVLRMGQKRVPGETAEERLCREWKIYRLCGALLMLLTFALQGIIILVVERGNTFHYRGNLIFAVALYDFYCLISSIVFMVRTRRKHSPAIVSVKAIGFATSMVAMLTLQTAMFASFSDGIGEEWQKAMNIVTGTVVCAILILWGAFMIRRSQTELKRLQEEIQ